MSYNYKINDDQVKLSYKKNTLLLLKVHQESTMDPTAVPGRKRRRNESLCKITVLEVPRRRPFGWKVSNLNCNGWRYWDVICTPEVVIFPTREGERITQDVFFPEKKENGKFEGLYTLSYPGTASTKCVVVFTGKEQGFVVGSQPSLKWAELAIRPFSRKGDTEKKVAISFFQRDANLYIVPFNKAANKQARANADRKGSRKAIQLNLMSSWQTAVRGIPRIARILDPDYPRFMLQMGIRDPNRIVGIENFLDKRLLKATRKFRKELGPGNIVHLFGTNNAGFDNGFPDFSIDRTLGGVDGKKGVGLKRLVDKIHEMGLMVSHHFNPRIAAVGWLKKKENKIYKNAVLRDPNGHEWIEKYKGRDYNVMNPSDDDWLDYCIEWVRYFEDIGFDYIELDQISYQRNIANPEDDVGTGFQDMINKADKGPGHVWIEGVSDIYKLPPGAWFQMLPRTRHEKWLNKNENRRGYLGETYPQFYRRLMPNSPISYQVVMDSPEIEKKIKNIPHRLLKARRLRAVVLDLELGFFNKEYEKNLLPKTLERIKNFASNKSQNNIKSYPTSIDWLNSWFIKP
jgi:hypothetical protein